MTSNQKEHVNLNSTVQYFCYERLLSLFGYDNAKLLLADKSEPIPYFQEAEWMKNKINNSILKIRSDKGNSFEVLQSGLYLMYAQVMQIPKETPMKACFQSNKFIIEYIIKCIEFIACMH